MTVENMPPYPLAEVLEIKKRRVEVATQVVREKIQLLQAEQKKLEEREEERNKVKDHHKAKVDQLRHELDEGTYSDRIERSKVYIKVVQERLIVEEKKVKEQKQQVDLAQKNLDIAKNALKDRRKEEEKIETHKTEWIKETIKELQVVETRLEDEIGSTMFLSKMIKAKDEARRAD